MTFAVFMFAVGGYAVVLLAAMLVLETTHEPVSQQRRTHDLGSEMRLRAWTRVRRDCLAGHHGRALPLRTARQTVPTRRRRWAPRSCRR